MRERRLAKYPSWEPSIKMSRYFGTIFIPFPSHTLSHILGPPKKRHTSRNPQYFSSMMSLQGVCLSSRRFCPGVLSGGFCPGFVCLEGFVRYRFCPSPILSEYICYNRKLNIIFNSRFHMYEKSEKCDVTCSWTPSPCHKLSHLLGPPPPRA